MKKTYLVGALMIGASVIFARPIKAQANPTAGVTAYMQSMLTDPPIAEWQKNILYAATVEEPEKENKKDDKRGNRTTKKRTVSNTLSRPNGGPHLTRQCGVFEGPSGKETFYNLPMGRVIQYMEDLGYNYRYWVREDGVKMYGQYVMCAADLSIRPKGTILETSLGKAIVCDTGGFTRTCPYGLDIATAW